MDKLSVYLEADHARCNAMYLAALASVAALDREQAALRFAHFAQALARHMAMEETVVFSAFEQAIGAHSGPTQDLRIEYEQLRGILHRLAGAIAQRHMIDVRDHADTLRIMLRQHSLKEDGILNPLADRVLRAQHAQLIDQMTAFSLADGAACPI